jgi:hypothetical protein
MRRYKYLEKLLEEEMKKVLVYIKGFNDSERVKLARMTALWISNGSVPPAVLNSLINVSGNKIFQLCHSYNFRFALYLPYIPMFGCHY